MATKKGINTKAAKAKVSEMISQAKDSLKLLEGIEKEVLEKAKTFAKSQASNEKLIAGLKKMGFATQDDLAKLQAKVEELEAEIAKIKAPAQN